MFRKKSQPCRQITLHLGDIDHTHFQQSAPLSGTFLYPLESDQNPHIEEAQAASVDWAIHFGLVDEERAVARLKQANFAGLFASALRSRSAADLEIMADFSAFLFILDDIVDHPSRVIDTAIVKSALTTFSKLFSGDIASLDAMDREGASFPLFDNLCLAILDLRKRLLVKEMDMAHFVASVDRTLKATIWGTNGGFRNMQKDGILLSSEFYLEMREATGAVETVLELACLLNGLHVSEELRNDSIMKHLVVTANHIICIFNDFVSLPKEIKENNHENTIQVTLFREQALGEKADFPHAIQQAIQLHNRQVYDLLAYKHYLPKDDKDVAKQYYAILKDCVNDNLRWSLHGTNRYGVKSAPMVSHPSTLEAVSHLLRQDEQRTYEVRGESKSALNM